MDHGKHLRPEIVFGYQSGLLTAAELREMDAHLSMCESCRSQLATAVDTDLGKTAASLRSMLEKQEPQSGRHFIWYAIAAGLAFTIGAGMWFSWFSITRRAVPASSEVANTASSASLLAEQQRKVDAALRSGRIQLPEFLRDLQAKQEVLLGSPPPVRMSLITPARTAVATPRPAFQWTSLGENWTYKVRIFAPGFQVAAESSDLTTNTWTAQVDLSPGISFEWQVTALRGDQRLTFPQPPLMPPRFRVLDVATVARIQLLATQPGVTHVMLAIAYAEAGAIDESRLELKEATRAQPDSRELQSLLNSLDRQ